MATAIIEEEVEEYCLICCSSFAQLKILSCSHVFCEDCLQGHIDPDSITHQPLIGVYCPVCREHVNLVNTNLYKSRSAADFENYENIVKCMKHPTELTDIKCLTCDHLVCCRCIMLLHRNCEIHLTENTVVKLKQEFGMRFLHIKMARNSVANSLDVLNNNRDEIVNRIKTLNEELLSSICLMERNTLEHIHRYHKARSEHFKSSIEKRTQALNAIEQNFEKMDTLLAKKNLSYTPKECIRKIADPLLQHILLPGGFKVSEQFEAASENMKKLKMLEFLPPGKFTIRKDVSINPLTETRYTTGAHVEPESDVTWDVSKDFINPFPETVSTTDTLLEPTCSENLYLEYEFEMKHNEEILGNSIDFIILSDNNIIITDRDHHKVKRFSPDGKCLCEKQFEQIPYSLCELRNNRVVVSFPDNMTLKIIDSWVLTVLNSYLVWDSYYSISTPDNEQVFCLFHSEKLFVHHLVFDETKGLIKKKVIPVPRSSISFPINCRLRVLRSGLLLVSDSMNTNLICFNETGTCLYNYALLDKPTAILDIAIDTDSIYLLCAENLIIRKLDYNGKFMLDIKIPHASVPNCMSVTDSGQLILVDIKNDCPKLRMYRIIS